MNTEKWQQHTLLASQAETEGRDMTAIMHYQSALSESRQFSFADEGAEALEDILTIKVMSCHNLANFWRSQGDTEYELKYLQLASEEVMAILPQCPRTHCDSFISSIGCCKSALIEFLKRHPNPTLAGHVAQMQSTDNCELIVKFKIQ
ncbi:hypothetical protein JCM19236_3537 [Vibrio sp. JCM 19236]|nr:hypothetical protein JCM19236_3537 [Vibrio sp. JCM 19236]